jgi:hypothetical protein
MPLPRPNTFGTGHILISERKQAVVVPLEALQSDGDNHFVFVRLPSKKATPAEKDEETAEEKPLFEFRLVRPGLRGDKLVEVRGFRPGELAVRPGEEVVTSGSFALKSELQKDRIAGAD